MDSVGATILPDELYTLVYAVVPDGIVVAAEGLNNLPDLVGDLQLGELHYLPAHKDKRMVPILNSVLQAPEKRAPSTMVLLLRVGTKYLTEKMLEKFLLP